MTNARVGSAKEEYIHGPRFAEAAIQPENAIWSGGRRRRVGYGSDKRLTHLGRRLLYVYRGFASDGHLQSAGHAWTHLCLLGGLCHLRLGLLLPDVHDLGPRGILL